MSRKYNPRRHKFTPEERSNGGKAGFRAAVAKVQEREGTDFNEAVQWLKRKIGWKKPSELRKEE